MQHQINTFETENASAPLTRQIMLRSAPAATAELTVNPNATAQEKSVLEKLQHLMLEAEAMLDEFQDGKFYAVIHPLSKTETPTALVERTETLEEEIDRCVRKLEGLLARMHPDAKITTTPCRGGGLRDGGILFNVRYPVEPPVGIRFSDWIVAHEAAT